MLLSYYILSAILILASTLPFVPHQHWMFRLWEFARIQITIFELILITLALIVIEEKTLIFWSTIVMHLVFIIYNLIVLIPYTTLNRKKRAIPENLEKISILSVNVYQFNQKYENLIKLVREVKPDILLTMESNKDWENGLSELEEEYSNFKKVALENTYGIHIYTKLRLKNVEVNYFVAEDIPSIEASILTEKGKQFTFFGVHPPPPSPTEEDTSKERDGELLSLAKKVLEKKGPVIVVGDFNTVVWSKPSILFRKTSKLIDPRIGRGFVSTFHAKYRLLRFPIDLFFHSTDVFIEEFKTLRNIGSDHLPLYCKFLINENDDSQEEEVVTLKEGDKEEVEEMIEDGIEEEGDRDEVVSE